MWNAGENIFSLLKEIIQRSGVEFPSNYTSSADPVLTIVQVRKTRYLVKQIDKIGETKLYYVSYLFFFCHTYVAFRKRPFQMSNALIKYDKTG